MTSLPLAISVAFLVAGCADDPTHPDTGSGPDPVAPAFAKGGVPGPPSDDGGGSDEIPLDITLRDADADRIRSDGAGAYHDGVDGAVVVIMSNGNLSFDLTSSTRCTVLGFGDFSFSGQCVATRTSTGDPTVEGGFPALAAGESMLTRSQVTWKADGKNWFLRYGRDCADGAGADVDENRVVVTRVDADTWTYATDDKDGIAPNAFLCSSSIRGPPDNSFEGEFHVPYGMTLVRQP